MRVSLLFALLFLSLFGQAQQIEFYREDINFQLDSLNFTVSGMYYFKNIAPKPAFSQIYYPYVYSTNIIDSISVYNCNSMEYIETVKGKKGHYFKLNIPANDSIVFHIKYCHRHNDSLVTYILTTTKHWHKPFNVATYTLRSHNSINITELFMPSDTTWNQNGYTYFYWKKHRFMPKKDFIISFNRLYK